MCEGYKLEMEERTVDDSTICVVIRYGYLLNNHVNNVRDGPYTALFLV